ncbi:MAG: class II fructose-bisphosphate aldolase [Planctomycetes bacterium]|nr:class II fructose-bisphosphate aldolase [Planctomycetota bacterium]
MPLESIRELTQQAYKNGYGIGYFESWNLESLQGVLDAAEQTRSPIIIGFNGQFMSDPDRHAAENISWYGALGRAAAESTTVPCGFIFNECPEDEWVLQAVTSGFNLVMPADSGASHDDYMLRVKEITEYAHANDVAVEAEIDELPFGGGGDVVSDTVNHGIGVMTTNPNRVAEFVEATDVDLMAISVGNVHISLNGEMDLDLDRVAQIRDRVSVPLVLHGGTGISSRTLRQAVTMGVVKVNYGTYLKQRYLRAIRKALANDQANPHVLLGMGSRQDIMVVGRQAVRDAVLERIHLLGCCGKA